MEDEEKEKDLFCWRVRVDLATQECLAGFRRGAGVHLIMKNARARAHTHIRIQELPRYRSFIQLQQRLA